MNMEAEGIKNLIITDAIRRQMESIRQDDLIDISSFKSGIYMVQFYHHHVLYSHKFIKQL